MARGENVQGGNVQRKGASPGCCCWSARLSLTINDLCAHSIYCGHILCPLPDVYYPIGRPEIHAQFLTDQRSWYTSVAGLVKCEFLTALSHTCMAKVFAALWMHTRRSIRKRASIGGPRVRRTDNEGAVMMQTVANLSPSRRNCSLAYYAEWFEQLVGLMSRNFF